MNHFTLFRTLSGVMLLVLTLTLTNQSAKACDRSSYVLDSLTFDGSNFTVYTQFCIGGGVIGSSQGANNFTSTFAFALYGPTTMQMISYAPNSLTSDSTGCLANSTTFSGGVGINADTGVAYVPGCFYTCINSTVACGRPHADCDQLVLTLNELPDSIRLFGVEGSGNPVAGCFPEPDMVLDFTVLPVVWSSFGAVKNGEQVDLNWSTAQEHNNDHFEVMRRGSTQSWEEIGQVEAVGYSDERQSYSFTDYSPLNGLNQYKIVQIDQDGQSSQSETVSVEFQADDEFRWLGIGPNPATDLIKAGFVSPEDQAYELSLFDINGSKVYAQSVEGRAGNNELSIDLSPLASGTYFIKLSGRHGSLQKRILKM